VERGEKHAICLGEERTREAGGERGTTLRNTNIKKKREGRSILKRKVRGEKKEQTALSSERKMAANPTG